MIHVRIARLATTPEQVAEANRTLDGAEWRRAMSIRPHEARARFQSSRAFLRQVLADHLGCAPRAVALRQRCARCGGPHGPIDVESTPAVRCSVSRSATLAAVAVTTGHDLVGVDVAEDVGVDWVGEIAQVVLCETERASLSVIPPARAADSVRRSWCRKEAALKAFGVGLLFPPDRVDVARDEVAVPDLGHRSLRLHTRTTASGAFVTVATTAEGEPTWSEP